eukprot:TRINITY_DN3044_c0_g1_i1.p4 TRINITY_DN3044_c0_g1~~TRINITY_DN3044_c0_g1_i1.p4  ORF type:complete len:105 (+),score=55.99 TRINITY_DN3044_c0_g1_i1:132-446(+)
MCIRDRSTVVIVVPMDWLKKAQDKCVEGGNAVGKAVQKKEIEASIWECERKIKGLQEEWGVAAFDASANNDDDTVKGLTAEFGAKMDPWRTKMQGLVERLQNFE